MTTTEAPSDWGSMLSTLTKNLQWNIVLGPLHPFWGSHRRRAASLSIQFSQRVLLLLFFLTFFSVELKEGECDKNEPIVPSAPITPFIFYGQKYECFIYLLCTFYFLLHSHGVRQRNTWLSMIDRRDAAVTGDRLVILMIAVIISTIVFSIILLSFFLIFSTLFVPPSCYPIWQQTSQQPFRWKLECVGRRRQMGR